MNIDKVKEVMKSVDKYIEKCFVDAFAKEDRKYDRSMWDLRYVIIENSKGYWQLIPLVFWCKYARVRNMVNYRLRNNLERNYGFMYGRTDELRYSVYEDGTVDYNNTEAMFTCTKGNKVLHISLSLFDTDYNDEPRGECMAAWRYEKLLFNYWNIDAEIYKSLSDDDSRRYLPDSISKNWNKYWNLYVSTFNAEPGTEYNIVCGQGVERYKGGIVNG